jgi:hypothetical protein
MQIRKPPDFQVVQVPSAKRVFAPLRALLAYDKKGNEYLPLDVLSAAAAKNSACVTQGVKLR